MRLSARDDAGLLRLRWGDAWTQSLHLWVLVSFAVAQPFYDLLAGQPEFFVFQNAGRVEILGLVVVLSGLLPLVLVAAVQLAALIGRRTGAGFHYVIVAAGVALTVLPPLREVEAVHGFALVYAALMAGLGVAVLYARFGAVRLFFTLLTPAVIVFPGMFVAASPVTPLLVQEGRAPELERGPIGRSAPIVFVVFDEFPVTSLLDQHERIDAERYPSFAALARDATWHRRATTVAEKTYDSLPSMLTGRYPRPGLLPHAIDHPQSLFTLLAGTYEMHVAGALTQLCPKGLCAQDDDGGATERLQGMLSDLAIVYPHVVLPRDLRAFLPSVTHGWKGFAETASADPAVRRDEDMIHARRRPSWSWSARWEQGQRFIRSIERTERPSLHFLHFMLPHYHYEFLPSGRRYPARSGMPGLSDAPFPERKHADDAHNVHRLYQRQLLQVGAVDTWLGLLVKHLREAGLYDETLLVVTTDHGISFRAGELHRVATETTFADILPVPLFIKAPYQSQGRIDDRHAELVDILPTMADLLDLRLPWSTDGYSLARSLPDRPVRLYRWPDLEPVNFTGLVEAMGRSAQRRHDLFGSGPWYPDLFLLGPHRDLVGRPVGEPDDGGMASVEVTVERLDSFTDVDLASSFIPAHITGHAVSRSGYPSSIVLAVAVNGVIEAVTQPWKVPVRGRNGFWSVMVPERAFRLGENTVEVFIVTEIGTEVRLARPAAPR